MNKKIHFDIGGMSCIHCQNKIENALRSAKNEIVLFTDGNTEIEV